MGGKRGSLPPIFTHRAASLRLSKNRALHNRCLVRRGRGRLLRRSPPGHARCLLTDRSKRLIERTRRRSREHRPVFSVRTSASDSPAGFSALLLRSGFEAGPQYGLRRGLRLVPTFRRERHSRFLVGASVPEERMNMVPKLQHIPLANADSSTGDSIPHNNARKLPPHVGSTEWAPTSLAFTP